MIEIQAKLLRGPVYFNTETIQCQITLRNTPLPSDVEHKTTDTGTSSQVDDQETETSQSVERLCWANVQLHCFCVIDEQQINAEHLIRTHGGSVRVNGFFKGKRSSIALETYASNDTSFHESLLRAEKGIIVYSSNPKILFCDLQLAPNELQSFIYTETLPFQLNPSYSSPRIKYHYKLSIGAQRIGSPINLLKIPIRIMTIDQGKTVSNGDQSNEAINGFSQNTNESYSPNSSFNTDDESKDDSSPLDIALHRIEYQTCHRTPHSFNITNSFGRVARFFIFKTIYKLGEDIIGLFNFLEGTVPCIRFSVSLQSEEIVAEPFRVSSKSSTSYIVNHAKCQEYTFNLNHSQMVLTIPLTATPSFENDLVCLEWKLHFRFVISQNTEQAVPVIYSRNEEGVQQVAPRNLKVQIMTWDFPIKVMPSHPAHVAKGFQMASIGTLNI